MRDQMSNSTGLSTNELFRLITQLDPTAALYMTEDGSWFVDARIEALYRPFVHQDESFSTPQMAVAMYFEEITDGARTLRTRGRMKGREDFPYTHVRWDGDKWEILEHCRVKG